MTLLEHLERRGKREGKREGRLQTLLWQLSAAIPGFAESDAEKLREVPDQTLDQLTDAIALRRPWEEIRKTLRESPRRRTVK